MIRGDQLLRIRKITRDLWVSSVSISYVSFHLFFFICFTNPLFLLTAEPLNDERCEATPEQEKWMVHAYSTCNLMHEFDMYNDMRLQRTKLLGNGYWRDGK